MAEQHYQEYEAYLQKLAEGNVTNGVIYEPRAYFDMIPLEASPVQVFSDPGVFRNGEDFPVVITHMTASLSLFDQTQESVSDERLVQAVGMYMKHHDQYYMNPPQTFETVLGGAFTGVQLSAPLPTWVNTQVATSDTVNRGGTSMRFPRPPILSALDSLRVEVMSPYDIDGTRYVTVAFTGIGIISRQPYFLSGTARLTDNSTVQIDTTQFTNDGAEPILLTDMAVNVQPESGDINAVPDSRSVFLRIRQIGNGTSSEWFQGPLNFNVPGPVPTPLPESVCNAMNLGITNGRAVVHEFPKALIWEPGEGIEIAAQALDARADDLSVQVALLGYIAVQ